MQVLSILLSYIYACGTTSRLTDTLPIDEECGSAIQFNNSVMILNNEASGYHDQYQAILAQNPLDMSWMFKSDQQTLVSFDGEKCPCENFNWFELIIEDGKYEEVEIDCFQIH